jgi:anti-sigma factor RsiW
MAPDCPRIEALSLLLDHEIHGRAREEIEAHAASCRVCGAALAEFRDVREALAALTDREPGVDVAALIENRLPPRAQSRPVRRRTRRSWQWAPGGLAAAGVLATGAYLGMLLAGGTAVGAARSPAAAVFSATPPGGLCIAPVCYARGK